jgi:hypothetical protein
LPERSDGEHIHGFGALRLPHATGERSENRAIVLKRNGQRPVFGSIAGFDDSQNRDGIG